MVYRVPDLTYDEVRRYLLEKRNLQDNHVEQIQTILV
jgi:hypothetical protein